MNRRDLIKSVPLLLIPSILKSAPKKQSFELIEIENASAIRPRGINNNGDITGFMGTEAGTRGFIRTAEGQIIILHVPGSFLTFGWGIDDQKRVAGFYYDGSGQKSFLYQNGQYITLNHGLETTAFGVSEGRVVGRFFDGYQYHGFLYQNGQFTQLDFPNAGTTHVTAISGNRIVGRYDHSDGSSGFLLENGEYQSINFPRLGGQTELNGVNSDSVLGGVSGSCIFDPFLFSKNRFHLLDLPGTFVFGINDSDQLVGDYGHDKGFIAKASAFISRNK